MIDGLWCQRVLSKDAKRALPLMVGAVCLTVALTTFVLGSVLNASLAVFFVFFALALVLPPPYSLFVSFAYMGIGGWLKDVTDYYPIIHLGPDLIVLAVAARWALVRLLRRRSFAMDLPLSRPIVAFVLWALLLSWTPLTNPLLAVGGLKAYVEPVLFYVIAYDSLTSWRQLRPFLLVLLPIAIAMPVYAFVQVVQGPQAIAALGPGFAQELQQFQGYYGAANGASYFGFRPLSFGGDPGNAASIDFAVLFMMLALAFAPGGRGGSLDGLARLVAIASIPLCIGGIFLSGARVFEVAITVSLLSLLLLRPSRATMLLAVVAVPLVLGGGALAGRFTNGAATARASTLTNPVQTYLADRGGVLADIPSTMLHHPLGIGMGKAVTGSASVSQLLGIQLQGVSTENFFLVMLDELGIPGALLITFINCALVVRCWQAARTCDNPVLRWFAVCVVMFGVAETATWFAGPTLQGTVAAFFWFLCGATLKLCRQECRDSISPMPQWRSAAALPARRRTEG